MHDTSSQQTHTHTHTHTHTLTHMMDPLAGYASKSHQGKGGVFRHEPAEGTHDDGCAGAGQ